MGDSATTRSRRLAGWFCAAFCTASLFGARVPSVAQAPQPDKAPIESVQSITQNLPAATPSAEPGGTRTAAEIDRLVAAALERRTKDKEVVEVGLALKAADLLIDWVKIFGLFVAVPGGVLVFVLGWFGISKLEDVRKILEQANATLAEVRSAGAQADSALKEAQVKLAKATESAAEIDAQLQQLRTVVSQNELRIESLGNAVSDIEQALKFAPGTGLSSSVQNEMSRSVSDFIEFFKRLGYQAESDEGEKVTVGTNTRHPGVIAYYDPNSRTIFVDPAYAESEYVVLREYCHHVLFASVSALKTERPPAWIGIEYGLADYFPGSFRDRSKLEAVNIANPHASVMVDLDNDQSLQAVATTEMNALQIPKAQEAWRGAFWEIRGELGQSIADQCIYQAWCAQPREPGTAVVEPFVASLLSHARAHAAQKGERDVRRILTRRGLGSVSTVAQDVRSESTKLQGIAQAVRSDSTKLQRIDETLAVENPSALPSAVLARLEEAIADYREYLMRLGYQPPSDQLKVLVKPADPYNAYFDGEQIVISPQLADMPDVVYRTYTHRALMTVHDWSNTTVASKAIESALSDYLPCSYQDYPKFGERYVQTFGGILPPERAKRGFLRNMVNDLHFDTVANAEEHVAGEAWGGAFWDIRTIFEKEKTDRLLFATWSQPLEREPAETLWCRFAEAVVKNAATTIGAAEADQISAVFERRGLQLQADQSDRSMSSRKRTQQAKRPVRRRNPDQSSPT